MFFERERDGGVGVYIFKNGTPPQDLHCVVCWELFKDPVITPLGHSFCRKCIIRALNQTGMCPITRQPLRVEQLSPNLLARSMVEELEVHCTYGCKLADDGWVVDPHGCRTVTKFGLRKAHHRVCKHAPHWKPVQRRAGGKGAAAAAAAARRGAVDLYEMSAYFVIWSLLLFGIWQSTYFKWLLKEAAWVLIPVLGLPPCGLLSYIVIEKVIELRGRAAEDSDTDSDDDDDDDSD